MTTLSPFPFSSLFPFLPNFFLFRRKSETLSSKWGDHKRFWGHRFMIQRYGTYLKKWKKVFFNNFIVFLELTIENNTLVLPHFNSTPSNKKTLILLLRPYAQTVFLVYAKVRKSAQFKNFPFLFHQNWFKKQIFQL